MDADTEAHVQRHSEGHKDILRHIHIQKHANIHTQGQTHINVQRPTNVLKNTPKKMQCTHINTVT